MRYLSVVFRDSLIKDEIRDLRRDLEEPEVALACVVVRSYINNKSLEDMEREAINELT
jgi:hypothetical protein